MKAVAAAALLVFVMWGCSDATDLNQGTAKDIAVDIGGTDVSGSDDAANQDTGVVSVDTVTPLDTGVTPDTLPSSDTGVTLDTGPLPDTSNATDTAVGEDVPVPSDTGQTEDSGGGSDTTLLDTSAQDLPTCIKDCAGKVCGGDGCGGFCGVCDLTETCESGQCVGECAPACEGKKCGADGCGGFCGVCDPLETCVQGYCAGECSGDCNGKFCGDDGCGASCGSCPPGEACVDGDCQAGACIGEPDCACVLQTCIGEDALPLPIAQACTVIGEIAPPSCVDIMFDAFSKEGCGDPCNGIALPGLEAVCNATQCEDLVELFGALGSNPCTCVCEPQCGSNICGDDGCGGLCGVCAPDEVCTGGTCVEKEGSCNDPLSCECIFDTCGSTLPAPVPVDSGLICAVVPVDCMTAIQDLYSVDGCNSGCPFLSIPGAKALCTDAVCASTKAMLVSFFPADPCLLCNF